MPTCMVSTTLLAACMLLVHRRSLATEKSHQASRKLAHSHTLPRSAYVHQASSTHTEQRVLCKMAVFNLRTPHIIPNGSEPEKGTAAIERASSTPKLCLRKPPLPCLIGPPRRGWAGKAESCTHSCGLITQRIWQQN